MAKVVLFSDGFTHIEGAPLSSFDTICGICDDYDNRQEGEKFEGELTCKVCKHVASAVFSSCKKSEVD